MSQSSHRHFPTVLSVALLLGLSLILPATAVRAGLVRWVVPTTDGPVVQTGCTSILNFCSLREALAAAADGDTIEFTAQTTGTILLDPTQGALPVTHSVTIQGPGAATLAVDGGNAITDFTVSSGVTASFSGLTIRDGVSSTGGGIANNGGTVTVTNSSISENGAPGALGGGIYNNGGTLTVTNSTLTGNFALDGGGIATNGGTLMVTNSTLSGNSAIGVPGGAGGGGGGGGLFNEGGTLTVTNSTLSGNSANGVLGGGGIDNFATQPVTLTNTLVANNPTGGDLTTSPPGGYTGSHNLIDDAIHAGGFTDGGNGNLVGHAALLGSLGSYGGTTQTFPLLPGSPAIDAGSCAPGYHDQRGIATVGAACDIGGFESQGFLLTVAAGTNQSTAVATTFAQPLVVSVGSTHGEPVQGGQVIFTAPTSGPGAAVASSSRTIGAGGTASVTATANGSAGAYGVTASAAGASGASFALANTPVLTDISPSSGGTAGGNHVTLTGQGFGTSAVNVTVSIGGVATPVASVANAQLVVTAPAHTAGAVDVVVTVNGERVTATGGYRYGAENALPNPQPSGGTPGSPNAQTSSRPSAVPAGSPNPLPAPRQ